MSESDGKLLFDAGSSATGKLVFDAGANATGKLVFYSAVIGDLIVSWSGALVYKSGDHDVHFSTGSPFACPRNPTYEDDPDSESWLGTSWLPPIDVAPTQLDQNILVSGNVDDDYYYVYFLIKYPSTSALATRAASRRAKADGIVGSYAIFYTHSWYDNFLSNVEVEEAP